MYIISDMCMLCHIFQNLYLQKTLFSRGGLARLSGRYHVIVVRMVRTLAGYRPEMIKIQELRFEYENNTMLNW